MSTAITSCTDIELAVLSELTDRIDTLRAAAVQKSEIGLYQGPTVSVAISDGAFEKVTQTVYRQKVIVNVLLTFKNERGEEERRKGINPLVQGVIGYLMLRDLGLKMTPLTPRRFSEVTDDDDYEARKILYLVVFETSFTITKMNEEEPTSDLLRVGLNYYLKPGDDTADASDIINLGD